jgi:hypothetical protein
MRYFLLIFALGVVTVMGVSGNAATTSNSRCLPTWIASPAAPQQPSTFGQRPPSEPALPLRAAITTRAIRSTQVANRHHELVATIPVPVTEQLMARGKQRFEIYCLPCHGPGATAMAS